MLITPQSLSTPKYMTEFRCLGGECPATCCGGWRIHVDRETYDRWQALPLHDMREALRTAAQPIAQSSAVGDADEYAAIALNASNQCSLLSSDGMCSVQKQLGEEAIPLVCHTFPRDYSKVGNDLRMYGKLGCPEIARLVLTDPQAMELRRDVSAGSPRSVLLPAHRVRNTTDGAAHDQIYHVADDAIEATADLHAQVARNMIAQSNLTATQAIAVLNILVNITVNAASSAANSEIAITSIRSLLEQAKNGGEFVAKAAATDAQWLGDEMLAQLLGAGDWIREKLLAAHAPSLCDPMLNAIARLQHNGGNVSASIERFRQSYASYFEPFERANPHVLKNLLLNDLETSLFPMGGREHIERQAFAMSFRQHLRRLILVGCAIEHRERFSVEHCLPIVQAFSRYVEQSRAFAGTDLYCGTPVAR
jgi:lysine-N-methylase